MITFEYNNEWFETIILSTLLNRYCFINIQYKTVNV
jgi:hypothetical protein